MVPWEARAGALGGARAATTRNALARAVRFISVRTWQPLKQGRRGCCAAAPCSDHRACKREQGVFFFRSCGGFVPSVGAPSLTAEQWPPSLHSPWLWIPPLVPRLLIARSSSLPIPRWFHQRRTMLRVCTLFRVRRPSRPCLLAEPPVLP